MIIRFKKLFFILLFLYSSFFVFGSTLAPFMAHIEKYDLSAHLTFLYIYSCHQQPDRSFWIFNYPIAICARCYGVYMATMIGSIFACFEKLKINNKIIFVLILVSCMDLLINLGMGFRAFNTGNITRFIVGVFIGIIIICCVDKVFKIIGGKKHEA